jgi:hypothetical protein
VREGGLDMEKGMEWSGPEDGRRKKETEKWKWSSNRYNKEEEGMEMEMLTLALSSLMRLLLESRRREEEGSLLISSQVRIMAMVKIMNQRRLKLFFE